MAGRGILVAMLVSMAIALAAGCAGKAPETPSTSADAANAAPPSQAANDPAQPQAPVPMSESFNPATAAGAVKGVPAPTNTAPIEAVANYYVELPGFDTAALPQEQREKFLQRTNSELCSCGCKNETLAHCLVNDPNCPSVKGLVQAVYDEVKSGR